VPKHAPSSATIAVPVSRLPSAVRNVVVAENHNNNLPAVEEAISLEKSYTTDYSVLEGSVPCVVFFYFLFLLRNGKVS
jgi:hypothetical protein